MSKNKEQKYEGIFKDFCHSFASSEIKEKHGVTGDKISPYHIMTCNIGKPSKAQIEFVHTGNRKEIHLTNFEIRRGEKFTIKDDELNDIVLQGEPTERTLISRDLKNPVSQTHQMSGHFDKIELRFYGGMYGRYYWIEARRK